MGKIIMVFVPMRTFILLLTVVSSFMAAIIIYKDNDEIPQEAKKPRNLSNTIQNYARYLSTYLLKKIGPSGKSSEPLHFGSDTKHIYYVNRYDKNVGKKGLNIKRFDKNLVWLRKRHYSVDYFMRKCGFPCLMTTDKEYLGKDNIDKFDALYFHGF